MLTLGLILDGSGSARRSEVFAGNVDEATALSGMLSALEAPQEALVVMDADVATHVNFTWLRDNGYRYLVVSRERVRHFDPGLAEAIETRLGHKVHIHSVVDEETRKRCLYCHSEERARKEEGSARHLAKLHEGLSRPRTRKGLDHVWRSIGRISQKDRGISRQYTSPHNAVL